MDGLMELKLSADESELLAQLLAGDRSRLSHEINHTDRREFRDYLRHRQDMLDEVIARLESLH